MKKLSSREKKLVILSLCVVIFYFAYRFALNPVLEYAERIETELPKLRVDLMAAYRLRKEYLSLDDEIGGIRERIDERQHTFNPYDFLDTLARKEGLRVNLDKITSSTEEINEEYHEEIVTIRLKNVSLEKLVRYLYGIENSGQLLTVEKLSIEPDRRNSAYLDVEFEVSTFAKRRIKESRQAAE